MNRRSFLARLSACAAGAAVPGLLAACGRSRSADVGAGNRAAVSDSTRHVAPVTDRSLAVHAFDGPLTAVDTPKSEWKTMVSDEAYHILFEAGTEPRGTSPLLDEKRAGTFICAACHLPLFPSTTKYDSGTGWPSFWAPLPNHIGTSVDTKLSYERTEYHCRRCGGHQGHVFPDGPDPTGLRYCNNGLALAFVPKGEDLPPLRG
jgi:peptide-methionine (R)-S-oxide reductase